MSIHEGIRRGFITWLGIVLAGLLLAACGGGGGGGGGGNPPAPPIGDVSGNWEVVASTTSHNCDEPVPDKRYVFRIEQNGNNLTLVDEDGNRYTGILDGDTLNWSGSYDEDAADGTPGRTTLERMTATTDASCDNLTGSSNWTWTSTEPGYSYSCSGTSTLSGSRTLARGCGNGGSGGSSGGGSGGDTEPPTIPANVSAEAISSQAIRLFWSASTDNVGVTGYEIYGYEIYHSGTHVMTISGTSATLSGLQPNTRYCYYLYARDAAGNRSSASDSACVTTDPAPLALPAAPSNVSVFSITHNGAVLTWTDNADNEDGYDIGTCSGMVSADSNGVLSCSLGFGSGGFTLVASLSANVTSYTLTGLTAETPYAYFVRARNSAGVSDNRGVGFTTRSAPVTSTVTITNNLSGNGATDILQLRIEATESAARSDANEMLSPDGCFFGGPERISSGESVTYTLNNSLASSGYYLFIGLGMIDSSLCFRTGYFEKEMVLYDSSWTPWWAYQIINVPMVDARGNDIEITLDYSGSNVIVQVYKNGVFLTSGYVQFVRSDPTTS